VQALEQHAVRVAREKRIPVGAPQDLDHVPARPDEEPFELLHDRAVAAHRAIQALQVAVDHEDQVVETLARRKRKARERFGLVHLAVADERPHLAAFCREEPAVLEVSHEARSVDRVDRPEAHRAGGELPELRHQIRMAVGGQPLAGGLAPVVVELLFAQPVLQKGARINAGRRMRLEIHQVAVAAAAEEMVEAHFEKVRGGGVAGDVPAELGVRAVGAYHHRERVPAHDRRQALLELEVARELRLLREIDRVSVGRVQHRRQRHAARPRMIQKLAEKKGGALAPLGGD
jgi:hypothetical protein